MSLWGNLYHEENKLVQVSMTVLNEVIKPVSQSPLFMTLKGVKKLAQQGRVCAEKILREIK